MTDWTAEESIRAIPPALVARARRVRAGELTPPRPRHAATVLLLRDGRGGAASPDGPVGPNGSTGTGGLEVYVIRRRTTRAFAAGMYAFPGGALDRADLTADPAWAGPEPREWAAIFGFGPNGADLARASVCAAVRESFEEAGVLLAGPSADTVVGDTTGADFEADRQALMGHARSLGAMLSRRGLVLRSDLLAPWARWVTPRAEERRFDTCFYLAALPPGQVTRDLSGESDRVLWARPGEILAAVSRNEMRMLPPTYFAVRALLPYGTVTEALAAARELTITPVMPEPAPEVVSGMERLSGQRLSGEHGDTDARWVFPGEPGHSGAYDEGEVR